MTMLPADWTLSPDRALRRKDGGATLIGGSPLGIIRLSDAGRAITEAFFRGEPIGSRPASIELAGKLLDRGMVHPVPNGPGPSTHELTVIIPVRDDIDGLRRTLAGLPSVGAIIVVDDASAPPLDVADGLATSPVTVLRNTKNLGPGPSRNAGLELLETDAVLFIDAGVEIDEHSISELLGFFASDDIVAVGPRILARPAADHGANPTPIDRFEDDHSPLDLGAYASPVRPGASVSYLPTACLLVRRLALREVGPFDPSLRYGEDVDLIWRLRTIGSVRYAPTITVTHPCRSSIASFVRQRVGYGSAAGPLGVRHGAAVAPLRASGWTLSMLALTLGGHGWLAVVMHIGTTRALVPKLGALSDPRIEAARLTATGNLWAGRTLARSAVRTWWPLVALGLALPPSRAVALRWLRWSLIERIVVERETDPVLVGLGLLDDLSYGAGVWVGALRARSIAALCPATNDQLTSGRFTIKSSSWTTSSVSTLRRRIASFRSS